jgi:hypothetical protein
LIHVHNLGLTVWSKGHALPLLQCFPNLHLMLLRVVGSVVADNVAKGPGLVEDAEVTAATFQYTSYVTPCAETCTLTVSPTLCSCRADAMFVLCVSIVSALHAITRLASSRWDEASAAASSSALGALTVRLVGMSSSSEKSRMSSTYSAAGAVGGMASAISFSIGRKGVSERSMSICSSVNMAVTTSSAGALDALDAVDLLDRVRPTMVAGCCVSSIFQEYSRICW